MNALIYALYVYLYFKIHKNLSISLTYNFHIWWAGICMQHAVTKNFAKKMKIITTSLPQVQYILKWLEWIFRKLMMFLKDLGQNVWPFYLFFFVVIWQMMMTFLPSMTFQSLSPSLSKFLPYQFFFSRSETSWSSKNPKRHTWIM